MVVDLLAARMPGTPYILYNATCSGSLAIKAYCYHSEWVNEVMYCMYNRITMMASKEKKAKELTGKILHWYVFSCTITSHSIWEQC